MSVIYQVSLMPIEPILFSDNRSARAGEDHLIRDQDPSPHTIYGAIGANLAARLNASVDRGQWAGAVPLLGDFEPEIEKGSPDRSELLGYYYADVAGNPWFPCPRHIKLQEVNEKPEKKTSLVGNPLEIIPQEGNAAASSLQQFSHILSVAQDTQIGKDMERDILIGMDALKEILCHETELHLSQGTGYILPDELYRSEIRLGLGMDNSQNRAKKGLLFSRPYRRFASGIELERHEWRSASIIAFFKTLRELTGEQLNRRKVAFLGGDRGRALIDFQKIPAPRPLASLKEAVKEQIRHSRGFFCYLLTPAVRENHWPRLKERDPVAAALGKEAVVSGWNSDHKRQHPRPIRKLIPAGSIFFYEWNGEDEPARQKVLEDLWLEPLSGRFRNSGFGRILIGGWK